MKTQVLLIFAKAPVAGTAKTRLIPRLGALGAAQLHEKLVLHTLNNLSISESWDTLLYCAGDTQHSFFQQCKNDFKLILHSQQGDDLGQRMFYAVMTSLQSYHRVCIVGTDCPVLNEQYISNAFAGLEDSDIVINPAEDGGYVLIATKVKNRAIFENIQWGTDKVLEQTVEIIHQQNKSLELLDTLWDVDIPEDLDREAFLEFSFDLLE